MQTRHLPRVVVAATASLLLGQGLVAGDADARIVKNRTRTSVHRNRNLSDNRSEHLNQTLSRKLRRDLDIDVDADRGWQRRWGHPVAGAAGARAATTASALAIGTVVGALPPSCATTIVVSGRAYQSCGDTWYQPRFTGTSLTYVVASSPNEATP